MAGSFIVYNFAFSVGRSGIDNMAHLGGLLGGALAGAFLFRPLVLTRRDSPRRPSLVAAAAFAIGLAAVLLFPRPFSVDMAIETFSANEDAALTPYNYLIGQLKRGEIGFGDAANQVSDGILPGWRKARATLEQQTETLRRNGHASPKQLQMLGLVDDLVVAREHGWERMVPVLRAHDEKAFVAATVDFNASNRRIIKEIAELPWK